jgi:glycosyltransferase involved in cell wall biosynthesis
MIKRSWQMKRVKNKRIHVLFLPRWYPHRYDPMMGLFIQRHGISVSNHVDVSVLYVHADEHLQGKTFDIQIAENDPLYTIRIYFKKSTIKPGFLSALINIIRFLQAHSKGFGLIKKYRTQPDLIHVHVLTRLGVVALAQKILQGIPYLITEHWTRYLPSTDTYNGTLRKLATRLTVKNAAAVLPVTANLRDAMIDNNLMNKNYLIIPNVVDIEMFTPDMKKSPATRKKIVHLSCFTDKQKNISGILRVIKQLSLRRNDFDLTLIGDGEDFSAMKNLSDQLGLTDNVVKFAGLQQNEALAKILREADLMIMFSNFENLPVVILESFASGVPVISTKVGGIHEHINDQLGKLIPPGDENSFLKVLDQTLDNIGNYNKHEIRRYAENHFSNEVIGGALFEVYQKALIS